MDSHATQVGNHGLRVTLHDSKLHRPWLLPLVSGGLLRYQLPHSTSGYFTSLQIVLCLCLLPDVGPNRWYGISLRQRGMPGQVWCSQNSSLFFRVRWCAVCFIFQQIVEFPCRSNCQCLLENLACSWVNQIFIFRCINSLGDRPHDLLTQV